MSRSAALPIAWITLRILIVVNWVMGALLIALLAVSFQRAAWLWGALGAAPIAARPGGEAGMRAVIAAGIVSVPITWLILNALSRVVETVRRGDPFGVGNADRIQTIAWALLSLEILHVAVVAIGSAIRPMTRRSTSAGDSR